MREQLSVNVFEDNKCDKKMQNYKFGINELIVLSIEHDLKEIINKDRMILRK